MANLTDTLGKPVGGMPLGVWLLAGTAGVAFAIQARRGTAPTVTREVTEVPVPVGAIAGQDQAPLVMSPVIRVNIPEVQKITDAITGNTGAVTGNTAATNENTNAVNGLTPKVDSIVKSTAAADRVAAEKAAAAARANAEKAAAAARATAEKAAAAARATAEKAARKAELTRRIDVWTERIIAAKNERDALIKRRTAAKKAKKSHEAIDRKITELEGDIAAWRKKRDDAAAERRRL